MVPRDDRNVIINRTKVQKSLEVETSADTPTNNATKAVEFLPASNTENPSAPPSQYNATDKGKILFSTSEKKTGTSWRKTGDYSVEVTKSDEPHVPNDATYMYEILSKQGNLLTSTCRSLGSRLFKTWSSGNASTDLRYVKNVRSVSQTYFRTFGRINTNKQSTNTVTLEGCSRRKGTSVADSIELDFRNVKHYSVFSGQIVAVEATNPIGDVLYVREIFAKAYAPPACAPRIESSVNIFVAAGPFTASNNMHYQPLWDLMDKVAFDEPHVLVLIGPFLEYTHPEIQDGLVKDTYQELFEKTLARIMESTKKSTQVILVASNRDAHHEPIFPTPQYTVFNKKLLQNYSNLKLMPDPCVLDIFGLKIGVTSVDVIKHIGKEEISNISGMDRLSRLADHVLAQTCFYPVYPPSEDLNVDTELWEKYAFFDQQPHVLILPSDMRCYCKVISGCVTLNPERMHKHAYARLCVKPAFNGKWSSDNVLCEIVKV
ncbi:DNA polymerase alpha subunit B isoform X2 [Odontomachus brunneus]|uniref:DNA polymerase alpha subunit B isoform X2 n=1 Tax=Odontomachus brunneus TaxID=486640 RepID=UPI0013F1EB6F|nr:DNA polymerase alpha subunit B isoform X2 [Odontomachus brunneus]